MKNTTKYSWKSILMLSVGFFLYLFFFQLEPGKRTLPLIIGAAIAALFYGYFTSWGTHKLLQRQIKVNEALELELEENEGIIAEKVANYKVHGGKLIMTNIRLCYIKNLFDRKELIVDLPIGSISDVQISGQQKMAISAGKDTYGFRLENAKEFAEEIKKRID